MLMRWRRLRLWRRLRRLGYTLLNMLTELLGKKSNPQAKLLFGLCLPRDHFRRLRELQVKRVDPFAGFDKLLLGDRHVALKALKQRV